MEKNKRSEFEGMVTQCIETEKKRKDREQEGSKRLNKDQTRSNQIRKRERRNRSDEMGFLKKFMSNSPEKKPYSSIKVNLTGKNNSRCGKK